MMNVAGEICLDSIVNAGTGRLKTTAFPGLHISMARLILIPHFRPVTVIRAGHHDFN